MKLVWTIALALPILAFGVDCDNDQTGSCALVRRIYCRVLFRDADADSLEPHANLLVNEGWTVKQLIHAFAHSAEFENRFVQGQSVVDVITTLYDVLLAREPDPTGLTGWPAVMENQGYREVVDGIIGSSEYSRLYGDDSVPGGGRQGCGPDTDPPTLPPTMSPTQSPTGSPTQSPTVLPTPPPTKSLTQSPTVLPTQSPTGSPTQSPTVLPTPPPTRSPSQSPTLSPTPAPTNTPTAFPTVSTTPRTDTTPQALPPTEQEPSQGQPTEAIVLETPSSTTSTAMSGFRPSLFFIKYRRWRVDYLVMAAYLPA